jgi:hypothetical protein
MGRISRSKSIGVAVSTAQSRPAGASGAITTSDFNMIRNHARASFRKTCFLAGIAF